MHWLAQNKEGDHVLAKSSPRVLSQPWGRKGDFQLPLFWGLTLNSFLGARPRVVLDAGEAQWGG